MLPKKFRTTQAEFHSNTNKALKLISPHLIFFIKKNNHKHPRFVISVAKILDKRSSYRHQTKRVIIEAVRSYLDRAPQGIDVLIKARKIIDKSKQTVIVNEIGKLISSL